MSDDSIRSSYKFCAKLTDFLQFRHFLVNQNLAKLSTEVLLTFILRVFNRGLVEEQVLLGNSYLKVLGRYFVISDLQIDSKTLIKA